MAPQLGFTAQGLVFADGRVRSGSGPEFVTARTFMAAIVIAATVIFWLGPQ